MLRTASINFLVLLSLAACETTVKKQVVNPETTVTLSGNQPNRSARDGGSIDQAVGTSETVDRLQKIETALLLYYSLKRELPATLSDLLPLTDNDLQLTPPGTDHQFQYHPQGLRSPGTPNAIIVSAPAAGPDGHRACIIMDDTPPGASLMLEPQDLPENLFLGYR